MGLCNSMWTTLPIGQASNSMVTSRFLSHLYLHYGHSSCVTGSTQGELLIRSVCSCIGSIMHLSLSQHAISSSLLGYISGYNPGSRLNTSVNLSHPMQHTYSCLSACRSSMVLATLCGTSISSHSVSLRVSLLGRYSIDVCDSKVSTLGRATCLAILIHACASSSASARPSTTSATYFFGPSQGRIMDIGCISLSTQLGLVGITLVITLFLIII
jgi:hypothetical protein